MPRKGHKKPVATGAGTTTKRPRRPQAAAAVREATARLGPWRIVNPRIPRQASQAASAASITSIQTDPSVESVAPDLYAMQIELMGVGLTQQALLNSLQEVKGRFKPLELKLNTFPTVTTILPPTTLEPNKALKGITPAHVIKAYIS